MNKKKYMTVGVFALIVAIGAGVAYYFDPAAINNAIGINSAQMDTVSDADFSTIDSASSSLTTSTAESSVDSAVDAPVPVKKTAKKKTSATHPVAVGAPEDSSDEYSAASSSSPDPSNTIDDASSSEAITISTSSCLFPAYTPLMTTKKIIFNEIAWMGSASSAAEWIEIKNSSTSSIDLSGWQLVNSSGKIKILFSGGDALAAGGLRLLSRGTATASTTTTQTYSGDLANAGDTLAIMDPQCDVSDYLDASHGWPGGNNTTKQTLERDADNNGWHTSASPGGTPGAENSAGPVMIPTSTTVSLQSPPPSAAQPESQTQIQPAPSNPVVVSTSATSSDESDVVAPSSTIVVPAASSSSDAENSTSDVNFASAIHILIAAVQISGVSSTNDLIRLYNPTQSTVDMSGWKLHKRSNTGTDYSIKVFPAGSVVAVGQSFTWANSTGGFSETVSANVSSTETLAADNSVALMDATGNVIDAVAWGTGTGQYGEGPPYPTSPGANQLLSRRSSDGAMVDTDNNTNDFTLQ